MTTELIGLGWGFPIRPAPDGRIRLVGGERKIRESIWLILSTAPGERIMCPRFGAALPEAVFSPNDPRERAVIAARAREALIHHEPRIDVLDVRADADPEEPARVLVHIDYRIRSNNAIHNLVYPFYLAEGGGA